MNVSKCCSAELEKEFIVDGYHGCDDEYELKVPAYRCPKCQSLDMPTFIPESYSKQTPVYLKIS